MASGSSSGELQLDAQNAGAAKLSADARFEKIKLLGSGTFGEAWLAKSLVSNRQYVIKELKLTPITSSKVCCHHRSFIHYFLAH